MARVFKCPCGDAICDKWMVSPGADCQGDGWDKPTAEAVAQLLNERDRKGMTGPDVSIYIPIDGSLCVGITDTDRLVVFDGNATIDLGLATLKRFDDLQEYLVRLRIHAVSEVRR